MFASLKNFSLRVVLPSVALIIVVNVIFSEHFKSNPHKRIEEALASRNYALAKTEYRKLIEENFFNVEYHRGYIRSHLSQSGRMNRPQRQDNQELVAEYRGYASPNASEKADIGHYGLGYFYSLLNDYAQADENFQQVRNRDLPYLNASLGSLYRRMGLINLAKIHLNREIQLRGNVAGAYANLAELLYITKQYDELSELAARPEARNSIPHVIQRYLALREGRYADYIREALAFRTVMAYGLLGALLIVSTWFVYLQQIDVFEPERFLWSGGTLVGGMIFACFALPLYDLFDFALGFHFNGTPLNDLIFFILGVGLIEETLKIVPVLLFLRFSGAIDESVDYIIYGSLSALGFAFMENLLPSYEWRVGAISTRAFGAVILHMTLTSLVMYGLFYSRYRVKKNHVPYFVLAFGTAWVLHGVYDFLLIKGWGILAILILIYCIRQYGIIINCTLNLSEHNVDEAKRLVDLTQYLCYSLAAIVMLQYVIIAMNYGPKSANLNFLGTVLASYFLLYVVIANLRSFEIQKGQWLSLLRKKATSHG